MQFLAFFGIHQMALSLFRFIAVVGRTEIVANTLGSFALFLVFVLGGFVVSKSKLQDFYSLLSFLLFFSQRILMMSQCLKHIAMS